MRVCVVDSPCCHTSRSVGLHLDWTALVIMMAAGSPSTTSTTDQHVSAYSCSRDSP